MQIENLGIHSVVCESLTRNVTVQFIEFCFPCSHYKTICRWIIQGQSLPESHWNHSLVCFRTQNSVNVLSLPCYHLYKSIVNVISLSFVSLNNSPNTNNAHQMKLNLKAQVHVRIIFR